MQGRAGPVDAAVQGLTQLSVFRGNGHFKGIFLIWGLGGCPVYYKTSLLCFDAFQLPEILLSRLHFIMFSGYFILIRFYAGSLHMRIDLILFLVSFKDTEGLFM